MESLAQRTRKDGAPDSSYGSAEARALPRSSSDTITSVGSSLLERKIEKRPDKVRLQGRILFLTEDPELIKKQLAGWDLPWDTKNSGQQSQTP